MRRERNRAGVVEMGTGTELVRDQTQNLGVT